MLRGDLEYIEEVQKAEVKFVLRSANMKDDSVILNFRQSSGHPLESLSPFQHLRWLAEFVRLVQVERCRCQFRAFTLGCTSGTRNTASVR